MLKKMKKAFTITELVIVIAVIAILAAVLIPTFSNVIESSKRSAALQTCNNALKDYIAQAGLDDDSSNDDPRGIVFVNDGYAYAYINGALHYLNKLEKINNLEETKKGESKTQWASGSVIGGITVSDYDEANAKDYLILETPDTAKPFVIIMANLQAGGDKIADKEAETIFFYSVVVNEEKYVGYFTMEQGKKPYYVTESAMYSHRFGFIEQTKGLKFTWSNTNPNPAA